MQTFVTKTATKKLQKKRNLFGLGITSLIAACSGTENIAESITDTITDAITDTVTTTVTVTTTDTVTVTDTITITTEMPDVILPFEAEKAVKVEKLAETVDSEFTATKDDGEASLTIEVKEAEATTAILTFSKVRESNANVEIYKFTPTENQPDLVVPALVVLAPTTRSDTSNPDDEEAKGKIFIFWDVREVTTETIDAISTATTNQGLEIKGAKGGDQIGIHAPEFLHLDGDTKYDMVIRSHRVDNGNGAIYILWDVVDYAEQNKIIDLGALDSGATSGSLAIYGAARGEHSNYIGTHAPDFLKIGGRDGYDMVIGSHLIDHPTEDNVRNIGAIYVLWDVSTYSGTGTITLDGDLFGEAIIGSLVIYGAKEKDYIGINPLEFLQIGGKADTYDMVIRSHLVSKPNGVSDTVNNTGAIYVLWDVADYTEINKIIHLDSATPDNASSGLLTIYGREAGAGLGDDGKNILYNDDGELTNIDNDDAGTIDIAITDGMYTYVFFGDKIADKNGGEKVTSKSIDLAKIADLADGDTYFQYTFGSGLGSATKQATKTDDSVGYRFADASLNTLDAVQNNTSSPFAGLSDADGDLGVWDIA